MTYDPKALHKIIDALRALAEKAKDAGYPTVKSVLSMAAGAVIAIAREGERDTRRQVLSFAAKDGSNQSPTVGAAPEMAESRPLSSPAAVGASQEMTRRRS